MNAGIHPLRHRPQPSDAASWAGESYPGAVLICAIGFFLRILLSGPVLNILGIAYGSEGGSPLSKIHPGTYLIIASFAVLLCSRRNPFDQAIRLARQQTAFFSLLAIYALIIIYWILRDPKGVGVILDIHIAMPICAIVFSYAPRPWLRPLVYAFAAIAVTNSAIGVFESLAHIRVFPFDPEWEVLTQDYFRASAFLGHPLTNAAFTGVSMFVVLGLRLPGWLKACAFFILLSSLIAFGGRASLVLSLAGLTALGFIEIVRSFSQTRLTVMHIIAAALAVLLTPLLCAGLLYAALHSGMGERLMAYQSLQDDSASVRVVVVHVFDYLSPADILFGVTGDRTTDIMAQIGLTAPTSDIENPWIIMLMMLGALMFVPWLAALAACVWRLLSGAPPALKMAVIVYFCIASTSNSFGREDPVYMIVTGAVVLAKQFLALENQAQKTT